MAFCLENHLWNINMEDTEGDGKMMLRFALATKFMRLVVGFWKQTRTVSNSELSCQRCWNLEASYQIISHSIHPQMMHVPCFLFININLILTLVKYRLERSQREYFRYLKFTNTVLYEVVQSSAGKPVVWFHYTWGLSGIPAERIFTSEEKKVNVTIKVKGNVVPVFYLLSTRP
jgi:hypothetical protein